MVRTATDADDESLDTETRVSTPDYRVAVDLAAVSEGDRITFTTRTNRSNGVAITNAKTLTVDDVTVEDRESYEMVEVEDDVFESREVTETHVEVVAIDPNGDRDAYRYSITQTGVGEARVSSCKVEDWERHQDDPFHDHYSNSAVSHGVVTHFDHEVAATDGGKPPGEDVHIARNFDKGGVWFRLGDRPRKLLSPDATRAMADELERKFDHARFDAMGYESSAFVDELRDAADDVEDANPDPDHDDFADVPFTDGGRPPLSAFDHAPTIGPSDVDKCRECGRYAPHAFDHAPECSQYEAPPEADADPARANPRMAVPATDGGDVDFVARPDTSPGQDAATIAALRPGDTVDVWVDDGERKVVSGVVTSHGRRDDLTVVAFDTFESTPRRCALQFRDTSNDPDVAPELFDPRAADTLTVRRVERR